MMTRRDFFSTTASGLVLLQAASPAPTGSQQPVPQRPVPQRPPALASTLVNEFVRKGHSDLAGTKTMLAEEPALLNAAWDWGGGDFETAIGGAGHMGNREIAEFLIAQGARLDIFVAAMLGQLELVRATVTKWPGLVQSKGPHGITLLRHAHAGGPPAKPVVEYLLSMGAQ